MATPAELIIVIAPEYASIDVSGAIDVAEMQIATGLCGDKRPLLVAYLAAHILTIGGKAGGATGNLSSLKEGGTAVTYKSAQAAIETTGLSDTSYGREYDRLSRGCVFAARTRVTNVTNV
jgi:Protein of unknown function (DUF4054)